MTDKNGYVDSILDTKQGKCYLCGRYGDTARHEIYFGPNRKISKANGFWINICPSCHDQIHNDRNIDITLKCGCERCYLQENHTIEDFIRLIGRNYI